MLFSFAPITRKLEEVVSGGNMETVKIVDVKGRMSKKNTPYYQITFEDGRKATTFDTAVTDYNGCLVVAEFKNNGDFLNVKIIRMVSRGDRPDDIQAGPVSSGSTANSIAPEMPAINPVFAFLGACSMVAPVVLDSLNAGNNIDDTCEVIRKYFDPIYQTSYDMLERHLKTDEKLKEYVETVDKLDS